MICEEKIETEGVYPFIERRLEFMIVMAYS